MGAITRTKVTLIRPTSEPSIGDEYQRDRDERDEITLSVWLKQISMTRSLSVLGQLTANAYTMRFRMPEDLEHEIKPGWRVRDGDGQEYEVRGVTTTRRMTTVLLEAVS